MKELGVVLAALVALTAPATASAFTVGGGATVVALEPGASKALKSLGVAMAPIGKAEAGGKGVSFPITGGKLVGLSGSVRHAGGIELSKGRRSLRLSNFRIVLKDRPFVQVKVNGGEKLKAFTLDVGSAEVTDDVTGSLLSGIELDLSRQGAKALNSVFKTKAFETATRIGDGIVAASARTVRFTGGQTDLALARSATDALTSLGIAATPTAGTAANPDGSLGFPITGGRLVLEGRGKISHRGGIALTKGQTSVAFTDFVIATGKDDRLLARVNGGEQRVAILNLDDNDADTSASDDTLTIEDVKARLTQAAAEALNQAFATEAFQAGLTLGTITIRGSATSR